MTDKLKIIVNCGLGGLNPKCVESLLAQSVNDWKAFVTFDSGVKPESVLD